MPTFDFASPDGRTEISGSAAKHDWTPLRHACSLFENDLYQVYAEHEDGGLIHLAIRRHDGAPILRDWQHFQNIKNELLGPECSAFEIYPAESRKVDVQNFYHLHCYSTKGD